MVLMLVLSGCMSPDSDYRDYYEDEPYTPTVVYEDTEFIDWMMDANDEYLYYSEKMSENMDIYSLAILEIYAEAMENWCKKAYAEAGQFFLSSSYNRLRNEYKLFLSDAEKAAYYCYLGAKYEDTEYITRSTEYMKMAKVHIDRCSDLVDELT